MNLTHSSRSKNATKVILALGATLLPVFAHAHHVAGETAGFISGFSHPVHGLDHILAMLAVGLWATQLERRALWMVPGAFVGLMAAGGALGLSGLHLPLVEAGIVASVLVLGSFIAVAARFSVTTAMMLVGAFAMFHGFAHGSEMPVSASSVSYLAGFMVSTAMLHLCGIALGMASQVSLDKRWIRLAGVGIAVAGLFMAIA